MPSSHPRPMHGGPPLPNGEKVLLSVLLPPVPAQSQGKAGPVPHRPNALPQPHPAPVQRGPGLFWQEAVLSGSLWQRLQGPCQRLTPAPSQNRRMGFQAGPEAGYAQLLPPAVPGCNNRCVGHCPPRPPCTPLFLRVEGSLSFSLLFSEMGLPFSNP